MNIHALSGIQTRNPTKQAAAGLALRPKGHRDLQEQQLPIQNIN
jgi:hypothetical protein